VASAWVCPLPCTSVVPHCSVSHVCAVLECLTPSLSPSFSHLPFLPLCLVFPATCSCPRGVIRPDGSGLLGRDTAFTVVEVLSEVSYTATFAGVECGSRRALAPLTFDVVVSKPGQDPYEVKTVSPPSCSASGGQQVSITLKSAAAASVVGSVSLGKGRTAAVSLLRPGSNTIVFTCPASTTTGSETASLLAPAGSSLSFFDFSYVAPPSTITPATLLASGGATVELKVPFAPDGFGTQACVVKFGEVAANITSMQAGTGADASLSIAVLSAPAHTPGIKAVTVSCSGDSANGRYLDADVEYITTPSFVSFSTDGGEVCWTRQECSGGGHPAAPCDTECCIHCIH
jgi:hypothetical protein